MTSDLSQLNDDECKRILSVIERDFKLRQNEYQRVENLRKAVQQENQRVEYLSISKEFNDTRCLKCYKPFKIFFNPKETCCECQRFVCQDCSIYNQQTKTRACKTCLTAKELDYLTSEWFYHQSSKKYKRCGSAKVVRELHKREKSLEEVDELDEDLGYETLPTTTSTDSKDSGSVISYVIHDKTIKSELNEFSKRLALLVDNLQSDLAERRDDNQSLPLRSKRRESLRVHQQQITSEIHRARIALSSPLRRANAKSSGTYEFDLQNVLIQKSEEVIRSNLQEFRKNLTKPINSTDFDQKLAQSILDQYTKNKFRPVSPHIINSPSITSLATAKSQRESPTVSPVQTTSFQLMRDYSSDLASPVASEIKSRKTTLEKMRSIKTEPVDAEVTADDKQSEIIIIESQPFQSSSTEQSRSRRRWIDANLQVIRLSAEHVGGGRTTNLTLIQSKIVPSDDEQDVLSTWL